MVSTASVQRGPLTVRLDASAFPDGDTFLADDPRQLVARGLMEPVHASRGATVFRSAATVRPAFFWKEFRPRGRFDPFKARLRGSRAARGARGAQALAAIDIEAPRTLAIGEERHWLKVGRSFLVTEAVSGLVGLDGWSATAELGWRERRRIVVRVAHSIARIHDARLVHGDLRPSNVLCAPEQDRVCFLDNERTRRCSRRVEQIRNLVQIGVDQLGPAFRTDRVRFVHAYVERRGGSRAEARTLARELNGAVLARRERRRTRGLDPLTGLAAGAVPSTGRSG
jgi:tRNA A-37 threonylcarbamoyl transferase component Bud32